VSHQSVREIYIEALNKIDALIYDPFPATDEELGHLLRTYSEGVRQTRESRIARKALKDATYARMFGEK
jgi:hypothetical protein